MRAIAQSISYEVRIALVLLGCVFMAGAHKNKKRKTQACPTIKTSLDPKNIAQVKRLLNVWNNWDQFKVTNSYRISTSWKVFG
jgi:NADH:ubiquinone oxidoreductase subunit H